MYNLNPKYSTHFLFKFQTHTFKHLARLKTNDLMWLKTTVRYTQFYSEKKNGIHLYTTIFLNDMCTQLYLYLFVQLDRFILITMYLS